MRYFPTFRPLVNVAIAGPRGAAGNRIAGGEAWRTLPLPAQLYVAVVIAAGASRPRHDVPDQLSAASPVRGPSLRCLPDVSVEGQSADSVGEQLHPFRVFCRLSDVASPPRAGACCRYRNRWRLDAMHVQGEAIVSVVSHHVQHDCRGDDHDGDKPGVRMAWRVGAFRLVRIGKTDRWRHRHIFHGQHDCWWPA